MINFSQQLIKEAQDYFSALYQQDIGKEDAESFLCSLSQLADTFLE